MSSNGLSSSNRPVARTIRSRTSLLRACCGGVMAPLTPISFPSMARLLRPRSHLVFADLDYMNLIQVHDTDYETNCQFAGVSNQRARDLGVSGPPLKFSSRRWPIVRGIDQESLGCITAYTENSNAVVRGVFLKIHLSVSATIRPSGLKQSGKSESCEGLKSSISEG